MGMATSLTLLLSACGGGGGGGSSVTPSPPPPPPPPPPANSAPVLASANADQAASLGVAFTYDATQNETTFTDADGDTLSYTVSFDPAANGLTSTAGVISGTPADDVTITANITADDGNGGSAVDSFSIITTNPAAIDQDGILGKFAGRIDLENLDNYANQTIPDYITKLNEGGNPVTDAGATLGRVLFYDKALSIDDTISCSSCHQQSEGFSDPRTVSEGVEGGLTSRHSMRLVHTQFADETNFFWDERANSHEAQETQPIEDHNEHGFSGENGRPFLSDLIVKLEALEYYQELFTFAFGDAAITEERLQLALAQFTKSIYAFDSKFDIGRSQANDNRANFANYTADENAGKLLFLSPPANGGAGCQGCHRAPEFDIAQNRDHNGVFGVAGSSTEIDLTNTRSPSLREMIKPNGQPNGPFMHDGSLATLLDVVNHYDDIQAPTTEPERTDWINSIDGRLINNGQPQQLNLTDTEKAQLVAFLQTLSGTDIYTHAKWSDPFDGGGSSGSSKPNILMVISDDQGRDASAQYSDSSDLPDTPNFDALANAGLIFDNAWVSPTCSPTRASLISGKYSLRTSVFEPGDPLPVTETVLQEFLKQNDFTDNYRSAMIGKWHLGSGDSGPNQFGVDHFAGITGGGVNDYFNWNLNVNGTVTASTTYATTELTDQAIDWVADQDAPWFLWLSYKAPHTPFHLPPADLHDRNLPGTQDDIDANSRAYYLAAIEAMDTEFGRLWSSLTEAERDNTIVIFIGDNGTPRSVIDRTAFPNGGKGSLNQSGVDVPMFISGAGVSRSGEREGALITHTDLFPTLVEIAGQAQATYQDGRSFFGLLSDASATHRDYAYTESPEGWTIRSDQYKLIEFTDGSQDLFDLFADPQEETDLLDTSTDVSAILTELETAAAAEIQ